MASTQKLVGELNKFKPEVSKLRNALNELDNEKESWFRKKDEYSKKIKELIQNIKDCRAKRDELTQEVKQLKAKRGFLNNELSSKSKGLEKLKKERKDTLTSLKIKESPSSIKKQIERLEFTIETEALTFNKEQALMKKIKGLKSLYEDTSMIEEFDDKIKKLLNEIRQQRKEADDAHKLIQEKAKQSQILHEGILKISAEIDKMKVDEEEAFRKFSEFKQKFSDVNAQLKEKLKSVNEVKSQLDRIDTERREKRRQEEESFLKSKEEEINQKIKRGEKLTTEDLLVFQKFGKE